ncbi:MAG: Cna B-type domain-containing protein [Lachnospiraceae bacterium]|nr:Cna B-type domain-containing protein [Lachnospiraceae bacterium]
MRKQMKKEISKRMIAGTLAFVLCAGSVGSPVVGYASEYVSTTVSAEEKLSYDTDLVHMEDVIALLQEDEVVSVADIEVEYGSDFDIENDFDGLEYTKGKVKLSLYEAKSESGYDFSTNRADTYQAVYRVEPVSGNPEYYIRRSVTVREADADTASVASADAGDSSGGGSGSEEEDSSGDADPADAAEPETTAAVGNTVLETDSTDISETESVFSSEAAGDTAGSESQTESEPQTEQGSTLAGLSESGASVTESENAFTVIEETGETVSEDGKESELESGTEMETEIETETGTDEGIMLLSAESEGDNKSYVSGLSATSIVDGTAPFDSDDEAGDDSSDSNRIVRSFDYVSYTLSYTTALSNEKESVDSGVLFVEFVLPCSPDVAIFNMDTMNWMVDPVLTYYFSDGTSGTSYDDASSVVSQVLTGRRELTNAEFMTIPGAGTLSAGLYVGAASNGTTIQPTFTLWMAGNSDEQHRTVQPATVTVSAAAKYTVQVKQSSEMDILGEYDLSTGNENAAQDTVSNSSVIRGRMESYGITVMMENDSVEKGLKGLEFPKGEISFDITLDEYSMNSSGELLSDQSGYTPVMWDYDENERSSLTGEWGREFLKQEGFAYSAAPFNKLGCFSLSSVYDSCYDGGDWTVTQDADNPLVYHVTVKNYSVDTENYNFPTADNTWYKRTEDGTTYKANQACLSSGVVQVVLQFPYGDVGEITNIYFKVTADNFSVNETAYDTTASFAGTYVLLPPGSINVGVNFTTTSAGGHSATPFSTYQLGSTYSSGDAYSYTGNSVRLWQKLTTSSDESIETVAGLIKWDADAFEVDRTSSTYQTAGQAVGSDTIESYSGYFVGRSSNWSSEQEMSDTLMNDPSLHFYTNLDALEADGYICVGVFWVADTSYVANGTPFPQYMIDLIVKDSAVVGQTYAAVSEGWASYSDVELMSSSGTSQYTLDTDKLAVYDLYIAYCSASAYTAMGKSRATDAYYIKSEYDEDGNLVSGTHVTGFFAGTSLLVCGEKATVDISITDTGSNGSAKAVYDMDAGERTVNYSVQPYLEVEGNSSTSSEATSGKTTAVVTVSLPDGLNYDEGSSFCGGEVIVPEITIGGDGTTTLVYTLVDVTVGAPLDAITFSCTIGHAGTMNDVVNNQSLTASASISSTGDNRVKLAEFGNYSSVGLVIVKLVAISISKQVDARLIEQGGSFSWTFLFANESDAAQEGTRLADILPGDGDDMGSDFSGSYRVESITIDFSNARTSFEKDVDSMAFYVTDGMVGESASDLLTESGSGYFSSWTDLMDHASVDRENYTVTLDTSGIENMTAFYFDLGTLSSKENLSFTISVATEGNEPGDIYCNKFYEYGENQSSAVTSVLVTTQVVQRTVSGLAWVDADSDGIRGETESLFSGVTATLYRTNASSYASSKNAAVTVNGVKLYTAYDVLGNEVAAVTTGKDGSYQFTDLEAGTYYVVFGGMDGYGLTVQDAGEDDTVDSDATAAVYEDGSGIEYAYISSISLPELGEMYAYLFESNHNDAGFISFTSALTVQKVAEGTSVGLSGAIFVMKNSDGNYLTFEDGSYTGSREKVNSDCYLTTASDGTLVVEDLPFGTYVLSEYQAPDGYQLSEETWKIKVQGKITDSGWTSYVTVDGDILDGTLVIEDASEITTVTVTKAWRDNNNQDGLRTDVTLNLIGRVTMDTGETVTAVTKSGTIRANASKQEYTFDKLPVYSSGKKVTYSVTEETVAGYEVSYSALDGDWESGYSIVVTNTHTTETTEYTVVKIWDDDENRDGVRPETIEVKLIGSDGSERVALLAEDAGWTYTFTDLPVYWKEGTEIKYTLEESPVSSYVREVSDADSSNQFTVTNTHEIAIVDIPVEKIWDDMGDQDGVRTDSVTVILTGSDGSVREATLTEESEWKYTFTNLPVYWNEGVAISYSLQEKAVDGYSDEVVVGEDGCSFTVTNNHIPAVTDLVIVKDWDDADNQDGIRPESIHVVLTGTDGGSYEADLTAENGYSCLFSSLPVYYNHGTIVVYSVKEDAVDGYQAEITADGSGYIFTVTNTHEPETISVPVMKTWVDNDDQDGIRPSGISVTLAGSNGLSYEAELTAENGWQYTFEDVFVYWNEGETVEYTLTEATMDGYLTEIVQGEDGYSFAVTNTHEPAVTEVNVKKIWDDDSNRDGIRADFLHITLSGSDGSTYETNLTGEIGWAAVFTNLPVYFNHGELISYTVTEDSSLGYDAELVVSEDGYDFTFTNTHEIAKTDITVAKTWDDAEDQDGVRPDEVEVILTGSDGSRYSAMLTEENGWSYTFEKLPVHWNFGETIDYSLQETSVDGYSDEIVKGEDGYTFTVTNNHIPAVTDVVILKEWEDDNDRDGIRPDSVHVTLTASDGNSYECELNYDNAYVCVLTDLAVYQNGGELITYTVTEEEVEGYESVVWTDEDPYAFILTNTHTPQTKEIEVTKVWDDEENKDGLRADVYLTLTGSDGTSYEGVIEKDSDTATFTFPGLPVYYDGGQEVVYSLYEADMDGYTSVIEATETGFTVTNTHIPETEDESEPESDSENGKVTETSGNTGSPQTGDDSPLLLWIAVAWLGILGMAGGILLMRRHRRRME